MSTLLLDTNIVSYLFKRDTRADLYARHLRNQELAIAVMTVAELFQWAFVRATRSAAGLPISPQDAWVAATALRYRLPLVTHNPDDVKQIPGLSVISEA